MINVDYDLIIDNVELKEIYKKEIFDKYYIDFKKLNIGINDINVVPSWSITDNKEEPTWWIRAKINNIWYKLIFKDIIEFRILNFKNEILNINDLNKNNQKFLERLLYFYRNEINNFPNIFPKFIKETEQFFIFEFIDGDLLEFEDFKDPNIYQQYINKQQEMINSNLDLIITNEIDNNWVYKNNNIYFVGLYNFIMDNDLIIREPSRLIEPIIINHRNKLKDIFS